MIKFEAKGIILMILIMVSGFVSGALISEGLNLISRYLVGL